MMRAFSLTELLAPLAATRLGGDASFDSVSTDSRKLEIGQLFVALSGERFNGNDFVETVAEQGACAAVVSQRGDYTIPTLLVEDTTLALGQLAALNRQQFSGEVIGITGSSGKTSVKNMIAASLGEAGRTLATEGNLNNEIGLPLTLLKLQAVHRFAVLEMGAGKPGDIRYLCDFARPTVSVLLNAAPAHLEGFGSVAAVAQTKGEILAAVGAGGTAVFNADSEYADLWRQQAGEAKILDFGFGAAAVTAQELVYDALGCGRFSLVTPQGAIDIRLPVPGQHNVANALAAAAACIAAGVSLELVKHGLSGVKPVAGRLQLLRTVNGVRVIDDSYNANPGSVRAAIDVLAAMPGRRFLVLGSMRELGPDSDTLHADIGRYAAAHGIDALWLTGVESRPVAAAFGDKAQHFSSRESLSADLLPRLASADAVLVKGSRSMGMEAVVAAIVEHCGGLC